MMKSLGGLKKGRRKPIVLSSENLVSYHFIDEERQSPLVIEPTAAELNLSQWISQNRDDLRAKLFKHAALLFRGFNVDAIEKFQDAVVALTGPLLNYMERSSPRHAVKGQVYTSTDYPPNETIFQHNEQSYNLNWCGKISFYCVQASETGGQTPIADTRRILAQIDPEIRERFRGKKYMYLRNFGDGMGLNWPEVFQTENKTQVEAYCRDNQIEFEWKERNRLRTRQVRDAIHYHPETGEEVWFNHCTFFHVSTAPPRIRQTLMAEFDEIDLPNQTLYGDGTTIEPEVMDHLRECYEREKILFDWRNGDVLIIDNMLATHGRAPFTGPRKVLVSMSEPTSQRDEKRPEQA